MFTVTDLFPGALVDMSNALAINDGGVVVGNDIGGFGRIWIPNNPNGTSGNEFSLPTDISPGLRPVVKSMPLAINSVGVVVGVCTTVDINDNDVTRAFSFTPGNNFLVDLGTFNIDPVTGAALRTSTAQGINDAGQIVGAAEDANGVSKAFILQPGASALTDLLGSHEPSDARAITGRTAVGSATFFDAAGVERRQAYSADVVAGTFTILGTLLPDALHPGQFFGNSSANAVSPNGTIVGSSDALPPVIMMGVIYAFPAIPFGPLPSEALGVSSAPFVEKVVGRFWPNPPDQATAGFVFDSSSGMLDLNTQINDPDWHVDSATGVNAKGQISAIGTHKNLGGPRGILLTP